MSTEFISDPVDLTVWKLRTFVTQDWKEIRLEKDCNEYLAPMSGLLNEGMGIIFSKWHDVEHRTDFELPYSQSPATSCDGSKVTFSNFEVYEKISFEAKQTPELIIGEVAKSLNDCAEDGCSACHKSWWNTDPSSIIYTCTDTTVYRYNDLCKDHWDQSLCGENDLCFNSYPHGDRKKWKSDRKACRPLP